MAHRAVLFDMDGVLVDSYEAWFALLRQATLDFGLPEAQRDTFDATWGQGLDADTETFFAGKSMREVEAYYLHNFPAHVNKVVALDGAVAIFDELRRMGVKSVVATNTPTSLAQLSLAHVGAVPDAMVTTSDVERPKPAPDMVLLALERLQLQRQEVLFVGDSRFDQEAAAGAGVRFVGYQRDGDLRIETLSELPALLG